MKGENELKLIRDYINLEIKTYEDLLKNETSINKKYIYSGALWTLNKLLDIFDEDNLFSFNYDWAYHYCKYNLNMLQAIENYETRIRDEKLIDFRISNMGSKEVLMHLRDHIERLQRR